jgi:ankyrin repeat protein
MIMNELTTLATFLGVRHVLLLASTSKRMREMLNDKALAWRNCRGTVSERSLGRMLFKAVKCGSRSAVPRLLAAGANVNVTDRRGEMPLLKAIDKEDVEMVQVLLNANADVAALQNGTTPLHEAACHGSTTLVEILLANNAPVNMRDYKYGGTPLHDACKGCTCPHHNNTRALDVIDMLVRHGAELESSNKYGCTPLGAACESGHVQAVKKVVTVWILYFLDVRN